MPALKFSEIVTPTASPERDRFELFARDTLELLGVKVVEGLDRGADGGRDLILEERRTGVAGSLCSLGHWSGVVPVSLLARLRFCH
jgi:hypothetical protein